MKVIVATPARWLLGLNGDESFMPTSPHRLAAVIHEPSRRRRLRTVLFDSIETASLWFEASEQ